MKPFNPSEHEEDPDEPPPWCCATWPRPSAPVVALRSGSLCVEPGSIHALVGENGAGKSTLVKIVAGVHRRDAGEFRFQGEPVDFGSTAESKAAGIAVIYQEPTLFPDLSVTENIFMGRQPLGRGRRIDRAAMHAETEQLFARLGVHIDPRRPARGLSIADQQIIEIAKAISLDASLLIMDEPTAALSGVEVERLFAVARSLRDEGRALVFISHRFDEVFALCDTVTVMRDGDYVSTETDRRDHRRRDRLPDGRPRGLRAVPQDRGPDRRRRPVGRGPDARRASSTTSPSTVRAGEIVGLAGLVGAGRSEIARAVFGVDRYDAGSVQHARRAVAAALPAPGDRGRHGLRPRGPPQAGPGHRGLGRPQRRRRDPPRPERGRPAHRTRREPGRRVRGPAASRSRPARWTPAPPP